MKSTKELARELGLLRKRSSSSHPDARWKRLKTKCQIFSYLIVIDFESTCWENTRNTPQEIIEFPAVLLNTATGQIEDEFHTYVLPHEHPILSEFCRTLTGISQEKVDNGIPLNICLSKFNRWLNRLSEEKKIKYNTGEEGSLLCTFATWSDWDFGVCLFYECRRKQLRKPAALNSWLDLRATYRKFYERRPNGLNGALKDLGIKFEGREHSGLDDARNTARLAWRMIKDGCIMTVTKSLDGHAKAAPSLVRTFQACTSSNVNVMTDLHSTDMANSNSNKPNQSSHSASLTRPPSERNTPISVENSASGPQVSKQFEMNINVSTGKEDIVLVDKKDILLNSSRMVEPYEESECDMQPGILELGMCEDEDDVTIYKDKNHFEETTVLQKCDRKENRDTHKGNSCDKKLDGNQQNADISGKLVCDSGKISMPASIGTKIVQQQKFKILSDGGLSRKVGGNLTEKHSSTPVVPMVLKDKKNIFTPRIGEGSKKVQSSLLGKSDQYCHFKTSTNTVPGSVCGAVKSGFKTPFTAQRVSDMKVTPPLCKCGRRSKRRVAQTPGPNQGRGFFSCPHGSAGKNKGCGYFLWESVYLQNRSPQLFASPFSYAARVSGASPELDSVTQKLSFSRPVGLDSSRKSLGVRPGLHANKRI
ncbi:ERI1 exoribonuclease 2-like isoform X2 [Lineus longissimus]|uniref:ERI1 exoribonuclease 2-like isoform X2 n=1 Tax=Lineus longissimus TaxID=88925 RepID=UPI00315D1AA9